MPRGDVMYISLICPVPFIWKEFCRNVFRPVPAKAGQFLSYKHSINPRVEKCRLVPTNVLSRVPYKQPLGGRIVETILQVPGITNDKKVNELKELVGKYKNRVI